MYGPAVERRLVGHTRRVAQSTGRGSAQPRRGLPPRLEGLRDDIESALRDAIAAARVRLMAAHPMTAPLGDQLLRFVEAGGKRVRPILLLLGYRAGGGDDRGAVLPAAVAVELIHVCALVHDDLVDAAERRRGHPTAHVSFGHLHREGGWLGDPRHFGASAALLLGDLAHTLADEQFLRLRGLPWERVAAALRRFVVLREEVTAGQYLDVATAASQEASSEAALGIAELKSGRYSVARPLEIGAILAGAPPELVDGLGQMARPLGVAFQLRDDILGVLGDEAATGKSARADLVQGKRTLLIALSLERLAQPDKARFEGLVGKSDLTREELEEVRTLLRDSGGLDATEERATALLDQSLAALAELQIDDDARTDLVEMARYLVERST